MGDEASLLYHYTSPEGLKGILSSLKFRASDIFYLNDSAEFNYTLDILDSLLKQRHNIYQPNPLTYLLSQIKEMKMIPAVYVMAFSEEGDQLSQWRGYCPTTGGFNIGFIKEKLKKYAIEQGFKLEKCIYETDVHQKSVDALADEFNKYHESLADSSNGKIKKEILLGYLDLYKRLIDLAPTFKHPSFQEEKEWRIFINIGTLDKRVHYRISGSLLIPYMEVGPIEPDCISQIVVGPCPHIELSRQSVERLVRTKFDMDIKVTKSEIPYRNW